MLRIGNIRNKFQKRLIRPLYAQTQAYPYGAFLHASLRNSDGSVRLPLAADTTGGGYPLTRSADAYVYKGGLPSGLVVVKGPGETVVVHNGADPATAGTAPRAFGLLANFVGGELDDLGSEDAVGVWRGPDSVFEILAPAFDDTGLAAAYSSATAGVPVKLYAGADGRLTANDGATNHNRAYVADLVERVSSQVIRIDLKV